VRGMRIAFLFVPFPQEIWRDNIDLTEAEFKLLGYLLYHQAKFGKDIIALSDGECLEGKLSPSGERLDHGCGVKGRNNFKAARDKLIGRQWVEFIKGTGYKVLLDESSETDTPLSESDTPNRPNQTPLASETDTPNKEVENLLDIKPSQRTKRPPVDARYGPFLEAISKYWKFKNPNDPFEFSRKDGRALKQFLVDHREITLEQFRACLNNRAKSEGIVHTQDVYRWISRIKEFLAGPLDRFGKLLGTHLNGKPIGIDEYGGHYEGDTYVTKEGRRMPGYTPPPPGKAATDAR
jgi:hypothetical protein